MLPGGLYIRASSMLHSHVSASSYFRTINGFVYPRQPVVVHPLNSDVPVASHDPYLLMPIHRRVVGLASLNEETHYRLRDHLNAGTWVSTAKGLYRGDTGLIMEDEYGTSIGINSSTECVVGFLPRMAVAKQQRKRAKLTHSPHIIISKGAATL